MKQVSRLLSLLVLPAVFLVLTGTACDSKSAPERAWDRGAFQPLPENTKNYTLPAGITIDTLRGEEDSVIPESNLPLYMVVSNGNSGNTSVTFPAGLVFAPANPEIKYMMLLKDFTFTANAGVTDSIYVPTYGCNDDLDDPDVESFFDISAIEWDKEIQELLDLVAPKALNTDDALIVAEDALAEITDGDGLTDASRAALKALP